MLALAVLCAVVTGLVSFLSSNYFTGMVQGYRERKSERVGLASDLVEAERLKLTFPQVVVTHPAYVGKPVHWNVTVASPSSSYAEGRPAWPIIWTNPERVQTDLVQTRGRVLARVAAVRDDAVYLDYLGRL